MQKIETWRVKELAIVLGQLSELLRQGNSYEWANVFSHFHTESQNILSKKEFDVEYVMRLIRNIRNCFHSTSTLKNLTLSIEDSPREVKVNHDFQLTKARLLKILEDIERRTIEHIH